MIVEEHVLRSARSREGIWAEMMLLESIEEWTALSGCLSTGSDRLEAAQSYVCTLDHGDEELDATVVVTDYQPGSLLALRTTSAMAVVDERFTLETDGRGSRIVYAASATSSMFGPTVTLWIRRHVAVVRHRLAEFVAHVDD